MPNDNNSDVKQGKHAKDDCAFILERVPSSKPKHVHKMKFKCATTGKYRCDECGKDIERGDTIRVVDVEYKDGTMDRYTFCCKEHRNDYCDRNKLHD